MNPIDIDSGPACIRLCRRQFEPAKLVMNGRGQDEIFKRKKGSRILTHNGTKRQPQTFLCFLVKNETKKRQQFHWRSERKVLDYCDIGFRLMTIQDTRNHDIK